MMFLSPGGREMFVPIVAFLLLMPWDRAVRGE